MPEIIPNWHPAVAHFPIALAITATVLLLAGRLFPATTLLPSCGRLLLQLSALSAVVAAALGWYAFQTVDHDAAGHLVMLSHRGWAVASTGGLLLFALWDTLRQRSGKGPHAALLADMFVLSGSIGFTGWLGGEMVYRHGVGVSSAAFASPPSAVEVPAPAGPAAVSEPSLPVVVAGEHIHKDGKRHHH